MERLKWEHLKWNPRDFFGLIQDKFKKKKIHVFIDTLAKRFHSRWSSAKEPHQINYHWKYLNITIHADCKTGCSLEQLYVAVFLTSEASSLDLKDSVFIIAHKCLFKIWSRRVKLQTLNAFISLSNPQNKHNIIKVAPLSPKRRKQGLGIKFSYLPSWTWALVLGFISFC